MKKNLILLTFIVLGNAFSNVWAAQQYCQTPITATDGVTTVRLSCQMISDGNYQIKIESDVTMSGLGGSFCYINGVGGNQLSTLPGYNLSSDGKTITIDIPSTSAPNLYTPLFILFEQEGGGEIEKTFDWPSDIEWGLCSSVSTDNTPPVMVSASVVGTPAYNSVNLLLSATDDITDPVTKFIVNDETNGITDKVIVADASGNATLSGLTPETTYHLIIKAKDAAGNVSENYKTVEFTTGVLIGNYCQTTITATDNVTTVRLSCQMISDGNYQIKIESDVSMTNLSPGCYCYINGNSGNQLISLPGYVRSSDGKTITIDIPSTSAPNLYTPLFILFEQEGGGEIEKTFDWPSDIIWGQCDTEAPTSFTADVGIVTSTSVELLLYAVDNRSVIVYTVSYGSEPTIVTQNGTSGTQKSFVITGLIPETTYTFSIEAKDQFNNEASNSPIELEVTTTNGIPSTALTPAHIWPAGKVISIYSDVYTSVTGLNLNPDWGQSTSQSEIQVNGNNILKYENLDYQGIEFDHIHPISSKMNHLHIDIWTENETFLQLYPICWDAEESANEPEKYITLFPLNIGEWNSFDIPLTDFTSQGLTMEDVYQIKIVGSGNTPGETKKTVYIDNLYFYNDLSNSFSNLSVDEVICYPNPVKDLFVVKAKSEIGQIIIRNMKGQSIKNISVNGLEKKVDVTNLPAGDYTFTVKLLNGHVFNGKLVKQ